MMSRGIKSNRVFDLFQLLSKYSLSYAYCGNFTEALTRRILTLTEQTMNEVQEDAKTRKRVYFVIVESLQNITRHQASECTHKHSEGFFCLLRSSDSYIITSGNIICNDEIPLLCEKLERVNSLSFAALTEYYNEVLREGEISDKGGAGLGLIDMVRKSGNKLAYEFIRIDDTWSYFYFQSMVSLQGESVANNLDIAKTLHDSVKQQELRTLYQGKFSHDNLSSLVTANDEGTGIDSDTPEMRRAAAAVLKQLMLNICDHAASNGSPDEKHGLLVISEHENERTFVTGNLVHEHHKDKLLDAVERVNEQSDTELHSLYYSGRSKLRHPGLVELRVKSRNKLAAEVTPVLSGLWFASVKTKISY